MAGMKQESPVPGAHLLLACFIPLAPLSVNSLYQIIFSQKRTQLKPEARFWKTQAKSHIPHLTALGREDTLHLQLDIHLTSWYYKNGHIREFDLQNLEKLAIDAIFEKLGRSDALVFKKTTEKVESNRVGLQVTLSTHVPRREV